MKLTALAVALAFAAAPALSQSLFERVPDAPGTDDVYFVAQLAIEDMEAFQTSYVPGTVAKLSGVDAVVLAITPAPEVLEGEWTSNYTVLLRFADRSAFDAFYDDPEYQDGLIPVREAATSVNNVVLLPAFDPASAGG